MGRAAEPRAMERVVRSTLDGAEQPIHLFVPPQAELQAEGPPAPLLVSVHSWTASYDRYDSYDVALQGCIERGWVFLSPDFRGPNVRPEACASDLAVQDVLDAVAYAREHARVDARRIYVLGGSGGGHIALVLAHRAPALWAAVSAWVPVTDLAAWHGFCREQGYVYAERIEQCFGGPPGEAPRDIEYRKRSPLFWLSAAAGVPIDVQAGILDGHGGRAIPIDHSLRAFNVLAVANGHDGAALPLEDIESLTSDAHVPPHLAGHWEDEAGREHAVLFRREAGPVRLTLFDGGHVIDVPPALAWLEGHAKGPAAFCSRFDAAHANQGVAVDEAHVYAVDSAAIGKYDKRTGQLVGSWHSSDAKPLRHLNSGAVLDGKLYCAHSNYPTLPMRSTVEIWDAGTLAHLESLDLATSDGSCTWVDRHDGSWWVCFAHYNGRGGYPDKDNSWTRLCRYDDEWNPVGTWRFPPEVVARFGRHSCSGGAWGPDGRLYCTGHDRAELYALEVPAEGGVLKLLDVVPFDIRGQGIAFDRSRPGVLYGIKRNTKQVVALPAPAMERGGND